MKEYTCINILGLNSFVNKKVMSSGTLHFEKEGIFLGLLSYPYHYDGKELYEKLILFFKEHKKSFWRFEPDESKDDILYKPTGYRMFGSQGLAVLSLVDDYTFFNRHFNKNHIQTFSDDDDLIFNTTVISGVSETNNSQGLNLIDKAKNTFLREKDKKYHFIGIIRVKINHELLLGKGIQILRDIKSRIVEIEKNCKSKTDSNAEHIAIDCFDNDEMTVVAFSDDLLYLYNFLGEIRSVTDEDIGEKKSGTVEKHVFGSALLCFGYDVDYDPSKDISVADFNMNCLIETKAGHRDSLYCYLDNHKKEFGITNLSKNITGGCNIVAEFPIKNIVDLEVKCRQDEIVLRDVRRMKVVLSDSDHKNRIKKFVKNQHASSTGDSKPIITKGLIETTKNLMKKVGISKLVRERLMALYELYNNSCQNPLQSCYLKELQPTMQSFPVMIEGMWGREEQIRDMEEALNTEISNMENAIYDRLHLQKHNQPPLEYSGGIQQYLTSFDYAYKCICKVFSPKETGYVTITGAERASSERWLFNLNINDIVFPELFITTAWKEAANFAVRLFENYNKSTNTIKTGYARDFFKCLEIWYQFSQTEENFNILKNRIMHSDVVLSKDKTCDIVMRLMNRDLLMYFFKDYIVFHFAFQGNYQMLWYYYFKTMLQTTICYCQLNVIDRKHFVHMLMRLFMVGLLSDNEDNNNKDFIEKQVCMPFDHLISDLWLKDYYKTWEIAKVVFGCLEQYGFKQMNEGFIQFKENNLMEFVEEDITKEIANRIQKRNQQITIMKESFNQGHLVKNIQEGSNDYIICLFYAYLEALYELDNHEKPIKSLPRNANGTVIEFPESERKSFFSNSINILVDPTGGFFIPSSEIRKKYFQLRTVLYRSLWNYRFTDKYPKS